MPMLCPKCQQLSLKEQYVKGTDLVAECCVRCKGVWFDRGELRRVMVEADSELQIPHKAVRLQARCPRCDKPLYAFHYPQTRVTIEVCKRCTGIWLDANEISQIREARRSLPPQDESDEQADVGGVKGALIRFIDWAIGGLTP